MARQARRSFGRIRKRSSGRLQAGYIGPDGALHWAPQTFTATVDAEAWLTDERRLVEGVTGAGWTPPEDREAERWADPGETVKAYTDRWLPGHRRSDGQPLKARTAAHYRMILDSRILPTFGTLPIREVTATMVTEWFRDLPDDTPTFNGHSYALLRTLMNSALREGVILDNPCQVQGGGKVRRAHLVEIPTLDQVATITENMPVERRMIILVAAFCGLRFGELTELRRKDVDLTNGIIHVRRAVVLVNHQRQVTTPKSAAGVRDVTVPPHMVGPLRDHINAYAEPGRDGLIFPAKTGGWLSQSSLNGKPSRRRIIKGRWVNESATGFCKAREAAGLPDLHFHDLRHVAGVLAAQSGATLRELMDRLGHSTTAAALVYQHTAKGRDRAIAEAISAMATKNDL